MTDISLDQLGPVDYLIVEFPAGKSNFTGEMAAELRALVDAGTIRVMDVLIRDQRCRRGRRGHGALRSRRPRTATGTRSPARGNSWPWTTSHTSRPPWSRAVPPECSCGKTCGPPHSHQRPGARAVSSSPTDVFTFRPSSPRSRPTKQPQPKETEMPIRPARVGRVGVIGAPVAKTAVVAAAVTPGRGAPVAKTAVVAAAVTPRVGRRGI